MKILLILMIILSVAIGVPINGGEKGWASLWGAEFSGPVSAIFESGLAEFTYAQFILWVLLLIAHIGIVALPFLTRRSYFNLLLVSAPLAFILIYIIYASLFIAILLVPFIIVWIIALIIREKQPSWM